MDRDMQQKISDVQATHADELMNLPHVVGLGIGYKQVKGEMTDQMALVVMVDEKVPLAQLQVNERVPKQLDGVPLDVQQTGVFSI